MSRTPSFIFKTWALGLTAYALVFTREVPTALAQAPIETDCSTELDQPDTTYLLNTNVPGNCVIAADNVILDGQNLYTIGGDVTATTTATVDFTVRDVEVAGHVIQGYMTVEAGDLTVEGVTAGGGVGIISYYSAGNVTVVDSTVGAAGIIAVGPGATVGDVLIEGSTILGNWAYQAGLGVIMQNTYGNEGEVTIIDSVIEGHLTGNDAPITISGTEVSSYIYGYNTVSVTDSTIGGYIYGSNGITITNSTVNTNGNPSHGGNTLFSYGLCEITDSVITNPAQVYCGTLALTDTAPSLTVTPLTLELESGESFNPFSDASADDVLDGDLSGDIIVVGEVGEGPGTYELVYSVTDSGSTLFNDFDNATSTSGPSTTSVTRTVIRPEEGGAESTRVGQRSSSSSSKDTSEEITITPGAATNMDEVLTQLKTVLAQPINTNDPEVLKKLLNLLLQLMAAIAQLAALKE